MEFNLRVQLPQNYRNSKNKYEVLYYLDAWKSNGYINELTKVLRGEIPKMILVGIDIIVDGVDPAINRSKDYWLTRLLVFTPSRADNFDGYPEEWTGGAPRFLKCLETEMIELIDRSYRTIPQKRTLMGHSAGGLFCLFALLESPGLFENIVASSPPLYFGNHAMLRIEKQFTENHSELRSNLFYAVGTREEPTPESQMAQSLIAFREQLEKRAYMGLNAVGRIYDGETHASNRLVTYLNGLRYVFAIDRSE